MQIYEEFFHEKFNDLFARYMAHSIECYEEDNPSAEAIARAIEQNIVEHVKIYEGAVKALSNYDWSKEAKESWGIGYTEN